jgi:hypothetical protein
MVAAFDAARISGAYDHNSQNPFSDVKLPKNRRPKQPGRYATLENVTDMLTTLSDVAVTRASYIKVPVAAKKMAMARLDEALKVRKTRKQAK